jgi:DNA-binding MarR family transcriptional regulator
VNPTLRPVELMQLAECDQATASKARQAYFEIHPEQEAQAKQAKRPMGKLEQQVRTLLAENPQYTPSQLAHRTNYSLNDVRRLLTRIQAESLSPTPAPSSEDARSGTQAHPTEKPRPTVTHKAQLRPPLKQAARQRLEEAEHRLIEQGLPLTYEWLAREAHIGYHAVATFLQERRGTSQKKAE